MNRILMIPNDIRTIAREVPDQLGHLFWMSLIAVALALLGWGPWVIVLVMGVELMSFNVHVGLRHPKDGWLRHGIWGWVGMGLWIAGTLEMLSVIDRHFQGHIMPFDLILPTYYAIVIGTQLISFAIHKLIHNEWHSVFTFVALLGGLTAFVPIFL